MRESTHEVRIQGSVEEVIRLAFDLPAWPSFLPHYRWVRVLETDGERSLVEMACWRTGIPLKWRSYLWQWPSQGRMRFRHVAGPARGMEVEWRIDADAEYPGERDRVRVSIRHMLSLELPVIRTAAGCWVVGELFVGAVAARTLRELRRTVEVARTDADRVKHP
jgi:ribosome-associated toxin RatA of RatAB toxin-antitoxin module